jgi:serine/threonine-protein kinase
VTLGGRYELLDLIARGGMGEVWRADDLVLGRRVAVKALLPALAGEAGFTARFRAEARAMAALSHPGIVEIYDYGHADGVAYLVMQFVEGESLRSLVDRDGALAPHRAMGLLAQAADAIHAAHRQGIVHRDVKPSNLLLRPDGRLALTDFGIARMVAGDRLTAADEILGTSSYLAPEQVTGAEVGPATDVYALGVVAYELVTGRRPFDADTPLAVALKHVNDDPPPLPAAVPRPVRALIMRALAKEPDDRWPSAAALAQASRSAAHATRTAAHAAATPAAAPGTEHTSAEASAEASAAKRARAASSGAATSRPPRPVAAASAAAAGDRSPARGTPPGHRRPLNGVPFRDRRLLAGAAGVLLLLVAALAYALTPSAGPDPSGQDPAAAPTVSTGAGTDPAVPPGTGPSGGTASTPRATVTASSRPLPRPSGSHPSPAAPGNPAAPQSPATTTRTVPGMYGGREVEVVAELKRLGLIGTITYRATPDQCYAIEQSPAGGTVVAAGSAVDVVIATATDQCKQV